MKIDVIQLSMLTVILMFVKYIFGLDASAIDLYFAILIFMVIDLLISKKEEI